MGKKKTQSWISYFSKQPKEVIMRASSVTYKKKDKPSIKKKLSRTLENKCSSCGKSLKKAGTISAMGFSACPKCYKKNRIAMPIVRWGKPKKWRF